MGYDVVKSPPSRGRRQFVAACGAAAALAPLWWLRDWNDVGGDVAGTGLRLVRRGAHAFGTEVSITVMHDKVGLAERAIAMAFGEIREIESVMSLYRSDSDLVELNRSGRLKAPHPMLVEVLASAQSLAAVTTGAFDVTVQPLWQLWAHTTASGRLPSTAEIASAKRRVDWRRLHVTRDEISLRGEGMSVTLNGIAQGFASDRVLAVLRRHGIEHALVDTGELGALGPKASGESWAIGVRSPRPPLKLLGSIGARSGCVATSGDYETTFSADFAHHHIFDPHTGDSPPELASVTVVARNGLLADGLSTAAFVLGTRTGQALIERFGAQALFVHKDGTLHPTSGFALRPAASA